MNVVNARANRLMVSVDWLSFTAKGFHSPEKLIEYLGMDASSFSKMPKGAEGYKSMLRHVCESVRILYDGSEDMGIHVEITSQSVSYALECFKSSKRCSTPFGVGYDIPPEYADERLMIYYLECIREISDIARLDVAIDDLGASYFTVPEVQHLIETGHLVSPWRRTSSIIQRDVSTGMVTGNTCYIGSRKSDIMLRVYDKGLEQKASYPWVRWELEIKHDRALAFVDELKKFACFGDAALGLLSRYVRFIKHDNPHRSRCSMNETWRAFLDSVRPLRLSIIKKEPSVDRSSEWVKKQVAPTLAGLLVSHGGDYGKFLDSLKLPEQFQRLSLERQDMFMRAGIRQGGKE